MFTAFQTSRKSLNALLVDSLFDLERKQITIPHIEQATGIKADMLYKVRSNGALLGPVSLVTYSRYCSWHDVDSIANACASPTKHVLPRGQGEANGTILDELQKFLEGGGNLSQAFERGDYATCRRALEVIYKALLDAYQELEKREGGAILPRYSGDGYP